MKQNCKCNCGCDKQGNGSYYMAVNDVTMYKVHYDVFHQAFNYQRIDNATERPKDYNARPEFRFFGQRFNRSIKESVVQMLREIREYTCDTFAFDPDEMMNRIEYDESANTFIFEEFVTLGTRQSPKECQWERFYAGKYEFICIRHEIQILKTELTSASPGILKDVAEAITDTFHVELNEGIYLKDESTIKVIEID